MFAWQAQELDGLVLGGEWVSFGSMETGRSFLDADARAGDWSIFRSVAFSGLCTAQAQLSMHVGHSTRLVLRVLRRMG